MRSKPIDLVREDCDVALKDCVTRLAPLKGEVLVVTGGTGFVGTWIAEAIGYLNDVHGFGTQLALISRSTDLFKATRPHLAGRRDVSLIKSDVRHLLELPRETGWIVHAAGNPDSRFHSTSPVETMLAIADGTHAVLRAADRCASLKMFANLSSAVVYGQQPLELERMPETQTASVNLATVSSAYAEAKRYAETLCAASRSQARIPTLNLRPFAFVGPYQSLETSWALNSFIRDAMQGGSIRVLGDGQTVRSYLYGADGAAWMLSWLVGGVAGGCYNIGSPEAVSTAKLAQKIAEHFNPRPEVRLHSSSGDVRSRLVPDVSLSERAGLRVNFGLDRALARSIEWHKAEI